MSTFNLSPQDCFIHYARKPIGNPLFSEILRHLLKLNESFTPLFRQKPQLRVFSSETLTQVHPWPTQWVVLVVWGRCSFGHSTPTLSPRTHLYAACCKLNANRRLGLQIEFIARETWEQITFTNTGVTDKDNCKGLESISDSDAGDIDIGIG